MPRLVNSDKRERRDVLQGTIDEFPLIDVLGILQARNKTGRLEIERQAGRGLIYVRLGEPYYAESSLTRSLIGQKLVDIGAISDMQLRKALDRQAESGERLGQILLTHGVISADHVAQAVISQIKDALADLLAWEAGEFRWETGAEVEVEVPLFGASSAATGEGANPLAPHVVPITTQEPDSVPDRAQPEAVVAQADFPQGGTTMTGNEVTAKPNESFPKAGQDPSPEVVHSSPEVVDDVAAEETQPQDEDDQTEPQPIDELEAQTDSETVVEQTEAEAEPEPEPEFVEPEDEGEQNEAEENQPEFVEPEAEGPENEAEPENEDEDEENEDEDEENEAEPEPLDEVDSPHEDEPETESEMEPVADHDEDESESEEVATEPVADYDEDQNETDSESEPVADQDGSDSDQELDAETEVSFSLASDAPTEVPEQFHVPRIIRSQPAPELDEEFEAVFEATAHASFEVEPMPEPSAEGPYFDPPPVADPVFGADAFTPIAPVTEFDPTFVPTDGSADPIFDHGNFEPLPETPVEPPFAPQAQASDPVSFESLAESLDDVTEPPFEPVLDAVNDRLNEAPEPPLEPVLDAVDDRLNEAPEPPTEFVTENLDDAPNEAPEPPLEPAAEIVAAPSADIEAPPAFEMPLEPLIDTPEPEAVRPEAVPMAPEMPAADLMPVAASPPPPPPEVEEADGDRDVPIDEAPEAPPAGPVSPESLKDIKLDRSSLVRELSDLLR